MTDFFTEGLYRGTHFVTFLCDAIKISEIILLTKKSGVLPAFKGYCLYHKKRDKRVRHLCTNGGREYDSHKFTKFWDKHWII